MAGHYHAWFLSSFTNVARSLKGRFIQEDRLGQAHDSLQVAKLYVAADNYLLYGQIVTYLS